MNPVRVGADARIAYSVPEFDPCRPSSLNSGVGVDLVDGNSHLIPDPARAGCESAQRPRRVSQLPKPSSREGRPPSACKRCHPHLGRHACAGRNPLAPLSPSSQERRHPKNAIIPANAGIQEGSGDGKRPQPQRPVEPGACHASLAIFDSCGHCEEAWAERQSPTTKPATKKAAQNQTPERLSLDPSSGFLSHLGARLPSSQEQAAHFHRPRLFAASRNFLSNVNRKRSGRSF
jgi:hypothetical protein